MADDHIDELSLHYLYVKLFFKSEVVNETVKEANEYYFMQAKILVEKKSIFSGYDRFDIARNNDANSL
ncbi:MAG: hypothetical protein IPL55_06440 [Saprospiraceae bacterium]|nr:hypothetical protein [Saprospiraceae bacterium]